RAAAAPHPEVAPSPAGLQRILLAVDGSAGAMKAVEHVIGLRDDLRKPESLDVHLLSVQRPLSGDVNRFLSGQTLDDYHQERCEAALVPARAALDAAGLAHTDHWRIGEPGPTIAEFARDQACDMVVMGARGLGGAATALLGSVAQSAIEHANIPVLVVK
ncbi:MAG: universal stress protein, partial [Pseudomonadota bacterium]